MAELTIAAILAMDAEEVQRRLAGPPEERAQFVRIAAEAGIAEAQAVYAQMLLDGIGVEKDMLSALHWFQRAAAQDHVMAINMVGRFHDLGWGIPVDKVQALHWYKEAAERGLHWGMYNYATLLTLGEGMQQNKPFALTWFRRAAALGNAKAMNFVGSFYEDGWVVEQDLAEAARHYAQAAEGGDFRGQFNHARMLIRSGKIEEALGWLSRVPETATPRFLEQAADWLEQQGDPGFSQIILTYRNAIASH
jgi:uncharacterized protein